ncbi:MAG: DUF192 domain-containing protein [Bryobacteraceae bacterium]
MKQTLCVFNRTRDAFLGLNVVRADTLVTSLRGLLGRIKFAPEDGLWMVPSVGIHTFGMLFPIDLIYLDRDNRVVHLAEHVGPFRISPIWRRCASVLELRALTIHYSHTKFGDQLLICSPEDLQVHLNAQVMPIDAPSHDRVITECVPQAGGTVPATARTLLDRISRPGRRL